MKVGGNPMAALGVPADSSAQAADGLAVFLQRLIARGCAAIACALLLAELVILLAGVVSRYFFHSPLHWTEELSSTLFLWLAMAGTVLAAERGEHMRLSVFVARLAPRVRERVDAVALGVVLAFCLVMMPHAWEYLRAEGRVTTASLEILQGYKIAALPLGLALMAAVTLMQLHRTGGWRSVALATASLGSLLAVLWFATPWLKAAPGVALVLFFVILLAAGVLAGVPIAVMFGSATLGYLAFATEMPLAVVAGRLDEGMSHSLLLSVPLFVFLGLLLDLSGMAKALIRLLASLIGHVRGGLDYVLLIAMYLVSGISGSKAADIAAIAPVLVPEMKRRGADEGELVSLMSASAAMSETIPPSLVLIALGATTGVSIAALFIGGLMPAFVGLLALCVVVAWRSRKVPRERLSAKASWSEVGHAFLAASPVLVLPLLIRTAVVEGVATATEVSTLGIAYVALVALARFRQTPWRRLVPAMVDTCVLTGAILLILGCATAMAWALTQSGLSRDILQLFKAMPGGAAGFLAVSILAFVVLGMVLEGLPALVLFCPLLFPVAQSFAIHEVHYAMVVILSMGLGLFMPPLGVGFYGTCAICKADPGVVLPMAWAPLGALFVAVVVVAAIPWISTGFL